MLFDEWKDRIANLSYANDCIDINILYDDWAEERCELLYRLKHKDNIIADLNKQISDLEEMIDSIGGKIK